MTNPERPMDEPRYGRRSDEWTPDGQAPSARPTDTPWPQYGQLSDEATAPSSPAPQPAPYAAPSAAPDAGQPYAAPTPGAAPGVPYGAPYGAVQSAPALPGRGGGIAMLISGLVAMLILAPAVFFGVLLSGMNLGELATSAKPVISGQTVTVSDSGSYTVIANRGDVYTCFLTDNAGTTHDMLLQMSTSPTFWAQDLAPGDYVLECSTEGSVEMLGVSGLSIDSATNVTLSALGWSALMGFLGLILTVWGIIAIVRVNRQRREIQRTYGIY